MDVEVFIMQGHEWLSDDSRGRQEIFMCLVVLLCEQFCRFANGGAKTSIKSYFFCIENARVHEHNTRESKHLATQDIHLIPKWRRPRIIGLGRVTRKRGIEGHRSQEIP